MSLLMPPYWQCHHNCLLDLNDDIITIHVLPSSPPPPNSIKLSSPLLPLTHLSPSTPISMTLSPWLDLLFNQLHSHAIILFDQASMLVDVIHTLKVFDNPPSNLLASPYSPISLPRSMMRLIRFLMISPIFSP